MRRSRGFGRVGDEWVMRRRKIFLDLNRREMFDHVYADVASIALAGGDADTLAATGSPKLRLYDLSM